MSLAELFANIDILFSAGINTTADTIQYTLWLLGQHEVLQDQIYRELKNISKSNSFLSQNFTFEMVKDLL